jgi:hypothetical protein
MSENAAAAREAYAERARARLSELRSDHREQLVYGRQRVEAATKRTLRGNEASA